MCLTNLKTNTPKITGKDITVYKVIEVISNILPEKTTNECYTPFQTCFVEMGKTYKSDITIDVHYIDGNLEKTVEIGLHSLKNKGDAVIIANLMNSKTAIRPEKYRNRMKVAKCIIPAGSKIIEGDWEIYRGGKLSREFPAIASNEIKYLKILKNEKLDKEITATV